MPEVFFVKLRLTYMSYPSVSESNHKNVLVQIFLETSHFLYPSIKGIKAVTVLNFMWPTVTSRLKKKGTGSVYVKVLI